MSHFRNAHVTRGLLLIVLAGIASPAVPQTMYKCVEGAKTVYQDRACAAGAEKRIAPDGGRTKEDVQRERMQARADAERARASDKAAVAAVGTAVAGPTSGVSAPTAQRARDPNAIVNGKAGDKDAKRAAATPALR